MSAELVVVVVMEAFDGGILDRPVHPLNPLPGRCLPANTERGAIRPGVVRLGQSVLDPICLADHVEAHLARICCVPVPGLLGELDAVVGQNRVDAIGDGLEQMFEELPIGLAIRLFHELGDRKLAGPVNAHKEIELALHRLNLSDVDLEETDG